MAIIVYGIPSCSTVKKARTWLDDQGLDHTFVDFRKHPVGAARTAAWVASLGSKALRNTSGGSYRALPEGKGDWSEEQWVEAMAADPMLIKRPVIERDGQALAAGFRKPEALLPRLG